VPPAVPIFCVLTHCSSRVSEEQFIRVRLSLHKQPLKMLRFLLAGAMICASTAFQAPAVIRSLEFCPEGLCQKARNDQGRSKLTAACTDYRGSLRSRCRLTFFLKGRRVPAGRQHFRPCYAVARRKFRLRCARKLFLLNYVLIRFSSEHVQVPHRPSRCLFLLASPSRTSMAR
jgi:hypothetical protein